MRYKKPANSKNPYKGGAFRYLAQRGKTSRADKMNLKSWFQFPTAKAKKIKKKYQTRKRRQFLKKLIKI